MVYEVYVRDNDVLEVSLNYHPEKEPIAFDRGTFRNDRLELWESRGRGGLSREKYLWQNDQVAVIRVEHTPIDDRTPRQPLAHWNRFEARYDGKGLLELLCYWPNHAETVEVIYRRPPQNVTLEQMLSDLHGALVSSLSRVSAPRRYPNRFFHWCSPGIPVRIKAFHRI
jgi:hypothetical protein